MFPLKLGLKFVPPLHLGDFFGHCPLNMGLFSIEFMGSIYQCPSMGVFLDHRKHKSLQKGSESSSLRPFKMGLFSTPILTHPGKKIKVTPLGGGSPTQVITGNAGRIGSLFWVSEHTGV